ncbi:Tim44 domain-containing protein [Tepidiphilus sp. J10]|uniref:Tim44 domain-containing protein n=1 Tax=Tepidiphilus sp. J10 TaxID=2502185 RepID=UPI00115DE6D2|nr:Tim44-like domain-containing protein [Tepidiphilus sp. J10]
MKRPLLSLLLAIFASFTVFDVAEARRLGGGGMQRNITPATKPTSPASPTQAPTQRQTPAQQPSTTPQPAPKRSWMGPLAGLAAGLGLAALFHHLGLGEELGSLLLLVLFAVVLFALFRRFAGARRTPEPAYAGPTQRTMSEPAAAPRAPSTSFSVGDSNTTDLRAQLDEAAFLTEAKRRFVELQAAHDRGDWETIAALVTPELLADLRRQGGQNPGEKTDIALLEARLVDLTREDGHYVATVEFSGSLRESSDAPPQPFAEYWHLVKPEGGGGWRLAGIQPIA